MKRRPKGGALAGLGFAARISVPSHSKRPLPTAPSLRHYRTVARPYDTTPAEVIATLPPGPVRDFWLKWCVIQHRACGKAGFTPLSSPPHHAHVRVLPHIKKLDDCFGDFLVRVTCPC